MAADLKGAREAAEAKKDAARQKIAAAKREAEERKRIKKNPPPVMVAMPEPTGDPEADSAADLDAVQSGFRDRAKRESERFALATDSEYWACICFQTREQKDRFLSALGLLDLGDKYLDGQLVAERLGVELPGADVPYKPQRSPVAQGCPMPALAVLLAVAQDVPAARNIAASPWPSHRG